MTMAKNSVNGISIQTLKRLPLYLKYLESKQSEGIEYISMPAIAKDLEYGQVLVKKDLTSVISESGKPKIGHKVDFLIDEIKEFLGYNDCSKAVLVGAGQLGKALMGYKGFESANLEIELAFDNSPFIIGERINNIEIMDVRRMFDLCERLNVHIGIITVNEKDAQIVCNNMIDAGIKAIWNFAPIQLKVPKGIIVENVNLASSLAVLSLKLSQKIENNKGDIK
ncbi:MAG: redox-sensing transcriptional repressor Rex [Bacilli bacterium]